MKKLYVLHWLAAAILAASLPVTARAMSGHGMGGFAGGGRFMGGGPRASMGGGQFMGGGPRGFIGGGRFMGGGPRGSVGPRSGGFGFRPDDRFVDHRFVDYRFVDHRFVDHRFVDHRFVDHRFVDHRFVDHNRFFDHDRFFFQHQNRFFFGFDFVSFGFPWWYPWYPPYYGYYPPYYDYYPPYYGYSYDSPYSGGGQAFDYQYWTNLAVAVQSELARRGYYHGPTDGVIGSDSSQAIRAFQAAPGLPVTGRIDPRLLQALGIKYRSV